MKKKTKFRILILFFASFLIEGNISAATLSEYTNARDSVAKFILSLQYPQGTPAAGAFRKSPNAAYYDQVEGKDTMMYMVEPYFTHIACISLLTMSETDNDQYMQAVENWMTWYMDKITQGYPLQSTDPAYIVNYYYDITGNIQTTCPPADKMPTSIYCNQIDAEDSDPALFFLLAYRYYLKKVELGSANPKAWFQTSGYQTKLENFVKFIKSDLLTAYNLTIAKRSYAIQYTMDNVEVFLGLDAFAKIEENIYNNASATITTDAINMSAGIKTAINDWKMYPLNKTPASYLDFKLYGVGSCDGFLSAKNMYAFTPMIWPSLFGVDTDFDSEAANYSRNLINDAMTGWNNPDWTMSAASNSFWDVAVGYFFTMSSDPSYQDLGKKQAESASSVSFKPSSKDIASYIADAGWHLLNLQAIISRLEQGTVSYEFYLYKLSN